jgi:hypothetical protein
MNLKIDMREEKFLPWAPFLGALFMGLGVSNIAYYLISYRVPSPSTSISVYFLICLWICMLYFAFQFRNGLLRAWMLLLPAIGIVRWISHGYAVPIAWLVGSSLHLLAGILLVVAGVKSISIRNRIAAFLLFIVFLAFRYWSIAKWVSISETIGRH